MGLVTTAFTTPEINGSWNNWAGGSNPMTDVDGDNVWEGTISLLPGSYEYKFAADNWNFRKPTIQMLHVQMEILFILTEH